jgi:hypothetical protein
MSLTSASPSDGPNLDNYTERKGADNPNCKADRAHKLNVGDDKKQSQRTQRHAREVYGG